MGSFASVKKDFTEGSVFLELVKYALPIMACNALQTAYSVVDMMIVGRFVGNSALSGVATAGQVIALLTTLSFGFCTGGQVHIAGIVGEKGEKARLNHAIGTLFTFILIASVLVTAVGLIFTEDILSLLRTPDEATESAREYLRISLIGITFTFGYNAVSAVLRGLGNSVQPLIYIAISACVNVGLNFLTVGVFDAGTAGSAWSTVAGQATSFIVSVIYLAVKRKEIGFDFKIKSFVPRKEAVKELLKLGIPFALRSGAVNVSTLFLISAVNASGVAESALFGVGLKVDDLARRITLGVNYAVSTFVAQNRTAGKFDRVNKSVYAGAICSLAVYSAFAVTYIFDVDGIFGLFTSDADVISSAETFSRAILWAFPAMITMRATNGYIQGMGKSVWSFVLALFDGVILRLGLSYLFGVVLDEGTYGLFLGYGLATYGSAIPGAIYFFVKKRKTA